MQYILLINDDERVWGDISEEDRDAMYARYGAFSQEIRESGALVAANQLQPSATASTVRVRKGETLTTDGPFAETKEQLAGFYLIDVETLDEALEWAAKIPSAESGAIEVRPVVPSRVAASA